MKVRNGDVYQWRYVKTFHLIWTGKFKRQGKKRKRELSSMIWSIYFLSSAELSDLYVYKGKLKPRYKRLFSKEIYYEIQSN